MVDRVKPTWLIQLKTPVSFSEGMALNITAAEVDEIPRTLKHVMLVPT